MVNEEELVKFIKKNKVVSVGQTANQFGVDEKTAFSMLMKMQSAGKAKRVSKMLGGKHFAYAPQKKETSVLDTLWDSMKKKGIL